jgi:hypothetical protein
MLLEVLESVILLETFPFGKWHYTELANVDTPFFVNCANTALPRRMFPLGTFTLHNFHENMFPHITPRVAKGCPHEACAR